MAVFTLLSGTTTGRRILRVDNKEILRTDWLFKLVGTEDFKLGNHACRIHINGISGFNYEYTLEIDGKPLQKFSENRSKISRVWIVKLDGIDYRIVLEKDTLSLWVNGQSIEADAEFTDNGTETVFAIGDHPVLLRAISTGHSRSGINHILLIDGREVPVEAQ